MYGYKPSAVVFYPFLPFLPVLPVFIVQTPVTNGFAKMFGGNLFAVIQIRYGTGNF